MALTDGLVAYWKFNETTGSLLNDSVGTHSGISSSLVVNQTGIIDKSYQFDTVNSIINVVDDSAFTTTSTTVNVWLKTTSAGIYGQLIGQWGAGGAGNASWAAFHDNVGKVYFNNYNGGAAGGINPAPTAINNGSWHMCTFVWLGGTTGVNQYTYIDGSPSISGTMNVSPQDSTFTIRFGKDNNTNNDYIGYMCEVGFWATGLSAESVSSLYNGGAGLAYPFGAVGSNFSQSLSESFSLAESKNFGDVKMLTDSIPFTDSRTLSFIKKLTETLNLADSLSTSTGGTAITQSLSDTLILTDLIAKSSGKGLSDSMSLAELIVKLVERRINDSLLLADTLDKETVKQLSDTLSMDDSLERQQIITRLLTDLFPLTDSLTTSTNIIRLISKIFELGRNNFSGILTYDNDFKLREDKKIQLI